MHHNEIKKIFDKTDFLNEYPLFIEIDIYGDNSDGSCDNLEKEYN